MNQGQQTAATTGEVPMEDGPQRREQTTAMTAAASDDDRPQPGLLIPATPTGPIHNGLPPAPTSTSATTLTTLPAELLLHTTSFLPDPALLSLSLTTRRLHHPLLHELYTRKSAPRSPSTVPQSTLHAAAAAAAAAAATGRLNPPTSNSAAEHTNPAVKAYLFDTALLQAFSPSSTTTMTTTDVATTPTTMTRDGITALHRALYHALTTRQPRPLTLALGLAPAGFVQARWVERALVEACWDRDVVFAEGLLMRFGRGLLREALGSGRVVGAVLERAAKGGGERCFGGVVTVLLRFVVVDGEREEEEEGREERERGGGRLLKKAMLVGRFGCQVHRVSEGLCFVGMLRLMVEKGMVNFRGVTREQLEGWIAALPEETGFIVEFLLSVSGSPLPRP
jgi:hypothetical protein